MPSRIRQRRTSARAEPSTKKKGTNTIVLAPPKQNAQQWPSVNAQVDSLESV